MRALFLAALAALPAPALLAQEAGTALSCRAEASCPEDGVFCADGAPRRLSLLEIKPSAGAAKIFVMDRGTIMNVTRLPDRVAAWDSDDGLNLLIRLEEGAFQWIVMTEAGTGGVAPVSTTLTCEGR